MSKLPDSIEKCVFFYIGIHHSFSFMLNVVPYQITKELYFDSPLCKCRWVISTLAHMHGRFCFLLLNPCGKLKCMFCLKNDPE